MKTYFVVLTESTLGTYWIDKSEPFDTYEEAVCEIERAIEEAKMYKLSYKHTYKIEKHFTS